MAPGLKSEANAEVPGICILSNGQQGVTPLAPKRVCLYKCLWENDPTSHLIYYLSKHFPNEFMVSTASFKSSMHHDVHFGNYGPV